MSERPAGINKPLVAVLAVICLATGGTMAIFTPDQPAVVGAFLRVGAVMAALYFALPRPGEQVRLAKFAPMIVVVVVLIALTRRMFLAILPLIIVLAVLGILLRPKPKKRPR